MNYWHYNVTDILGGQINIIASQWAWISVDVENKHIHEFNIDKKDVQICRDIYTVNNIICQKINKELINILVRYGVLNPTKYNGITPSDIIITGNRSTELPHTIIYTNHPTLQKCMLIVNDPKRTISITAKESHSNFYIAYTITIYKPENISLAR